MLCFLATLLAVGILYESAVQAHVCNKKTYKNFIADFAGTACAERSPCARCFRNVRQRAEHNRSRKVAGVYLA